ncbi:hotdog domain-containing protein [Sulfurimonas sp. HSL1-6]|uniref:hotdog domain-containing protein n=1 Tax=Thiomicrolovo immobilis TaxID=3131935 RepID=UPI0031F823F0
MILNTHLNIDTALCGNVITLDKGYAAVELETTPAMAADDKGLVHGGFIFGAADYAAMAAVNEPTVVLAGSSCRFLAPSQVGETLLFKAECLENDGKKYQITVNAYCGETKVFSGEFTAVVLPAHVLG